MNRVLTNPDLLRHIIGMVAKEEEVDTLLWLWASRVCKQWTDTLLSPKARSNIILRVRCGQLATQAVRDIFRRHTGGFLIHDTALSWMRWHHLDFHPSIRCLVMTRGYEPFHHLPWLYRLSDLAVECSPCFYTRMVELVVGDRLPCLERLTMTIPSLPLLLRLVRSLRSDLRVWRTMRRLVVYPARLGLSSVDRVQHEYLEAAEERLDMGLAPLKIIEFPPLFMCTPNSMLQTFRMIQSSAVLFRGYLRLYAVVYGSLVWRTWHDCLVRGMWGEMGCLHIMVTGVNEPCVLLRDMIGHTGPETRLRIVFQVTSGHADRDRRAIQLYLRNECTASTRSRVQTVNVNFQSAWR